MRELALALFCCLGFGCARVPASAGANTSALAGPKCATLTASLPQLDQLGTVTLQSNGDACRATEVCVDGDVVCRCDVARGGAPRPNWWTCHRAKSKKDGCPDDDALLGGASCSKEGQLCRVPQPCSCSFFNQALCQGGHWTIAECGRCLAP
ncbi:MAG: hypothetical protein U0228_08775 [Myxococcaceae bacterium]